jgi:hypothetical protein
LGLSGVPGEGQSIISLLGPWLLFAPGGILLAWGAWRGGLWVVATGFAIIAGASAAVIAVSLGWSAAAAIAASAIAIAAGGMAAAMGLRSKP